MKTKQRTAIAYAKSGLWTYMLDHEGNVHVEGRPGDSDLNYSIELGGLDRRQQIQKAVELLKRDGWPMDRD